MSSVLHLSTVHPRNDIRIFVKQAQTLAEKLSHRVFLMVADGKGNVEASRGSVSIIDIGQIDGPFWRRVLFGSWRSLQAIRKLKPSIVHFHDPELILLGLILKILGYKVIYDVHEDVPDQVATKYWVPVPIRKAIAWMVYLIESLGALVFDAIVPATPTIAEHFPPNKTVTIQNYPIADELVLAIPTVYSARPAAFVYPGVIAEIRGCLEIVRALTLLSDIPGVRLDLAGAFSPPNFADELMAAPGWEMVEYHGVVSRERLTQLLSNVRAGLVVHHPIPNEVNAQPIKLYEYMSVGLPVIASDFPLLRRIIDEAGCGLLVDPRRPNEVAEAMRWILNHPIEAEAMGQRGRDMVEARYNWDVEADKLVALYNQLLS